MFNHDRKTFHIDTSHFYMAYLKLTQVEQLLQQYECLNTDRQTTWQNALTFGTLVWNVEDPYNIELGNTDIRPMNYADLLTLLLKVKRAIHLFNIFYAYFEPLKVATKMSLHFSV